MKITQSTSHSRRQGSAVIVVLALLSMAIIYAVGNARVLGGLKQQLKIIEMRQTNSWPRLIPGNQTMQDSKKSGEAKTFTNSHG